MAEGDVITVNSLYSGRVSQVYVEDGDFVEKNQPILSLDSTDAQLSVLEYEYNLDILEVQRKLYEEVYESLVEEEAFEIATSAYGEHASIAEAIQMEYQVYEDALDSIKDRTKKLSYKQEYILTILQNMNTLDVKIHDTQTSLQKAEAEIDSLTIKAPINGQVTQMSMLKQGMFVESGNIVGYLLPEEKKNLFVAYISDEDIGQIHTDDLVRVKIAAYNDTEYESLEGTIISIRDIAFDMDGIGASYMVEIQLKEIPDNVKIGMEGRCDIILGTRTVLDYFLDPFKEGLADSLKER